MLGNNYGFEMVDMIFTLLIACIVAIPIVSIVMINKKEKEFDADPTRFSPTKTRLAENVRRDIDLEVYIDTQTLHIVKI